MLVDGVKKACDACIRGHRVSGCNHHDRELRTIAKKGRPVSQCTTCRQNRRNRAAHVRCDCAARKESDQSANSDSFAARNAARAAAAAAAAAVEDGPGSRVGVGASNSATPPDGASQSDSTWCQFCGPGVSCSCGAIENPSAGSEASMLSGTQSDVRPRLQTTLSESSLTHFAHLHQRPPMQHSNSSSSSSMGAPYPVHNTVGHVGPLNEVEPAPGSETSMQLLAGTPASQQENRPQLQATHSESSLVHFAALHHRPGERHGNLVAPYRRPSSVAHHSAHGYNHRRSPSLRCAPSRSSSPDLRTYAGLQMANDVNSSIPDLELTPQQPLNPRFNRTVSGRIRTNLSVNTSHFNRTNFSTQELLGAAADSDPQFSATFPQSAGWPETFGQFGQNSFLDDVDEIPDPGANMTGGNGIPEWAPSIAGSNGFPEMTPSIAGSIGLPELTPSISGDEPDGSAYGGQSGPSPPYFGAMPYSCNSSNFGDPDPQYNLSAGSSFACLPQLLSGRLEENEHPLSRAQEPAFDLELAFTNVYTPWEQDAENLAMPPPQQQHLHVKRESISQDPFLDQDNDSLWMKSS